MSTASVTEDNRWALVLGGVATIIFGIAAVFWPGETLLVLLYLFSAYVLISGIINVIAGLSDVSRTDSWFLTVILGVFETGVGVYLLRHPEVRFNTFIILIGFTLIARGVIEAVIVYYNNKLATKAQALGYFSGVAAIVVGIVILFAKQPQGVAFVWILGLYALIVGTIHVAELASTNK